MKKTELLARIQLLELRLNQLAPHLPKWKRANPVFMYEYTPKPPESIDIAKEVANLGVKIGDRGYSADYIRHRCDQLLDTIKEWHNQEIEKTDYSGDPIKHIKDTMVVSVGTVEDKITSMREEAKRRIRESIYVMSVPDFKPRHELLKETCKIIDEVIN